MEFLVFLFFVLFFCIKNGVNDMKSCFVFCFSTCLKGYVYRSFVVFSSSTSYNLL